MPAVIKRQRPLVASSMPSTSSCPWGHILNTIGFTSDVDSMYVSAEDMKSAGKTWSGKANQFEPRLLAYQTSAGARPEIFKDKGLYLLPVRNGTYLLTKHNIYKDISYLADGPITTIKRNTDSAVLSIGNSETSLIDNLRYSGVFERPEILGEPILYGPMLNGRHRCDLDMTLCGSDISIQGVQYEVDSCFESKNKILLIEGKSSNKEIDSFNIRQLYFPYRVLKSATSNRKDIACLFIHELKGIVHIWSFKFEDDDAMDSITQIGHFMYKFT